MRKEKSLKNFLTSIIPFFLLTIFGFVRLKVLLSSLGEDVYALNQLFIQIFSYISLLEAGVGTLITQMYYQFFVNDDRKSINSIFTTSKRMLTKISWLMLGIGFIISFFLKFLTKNSLSLNYMQIVFILYLFRSVLEYLMFSPRFVISADQKLYKINASLNMYKVIEIIVEIAILQVYQNYIVILLSSIILRFIAYYVANHKVYKEYPWLKVQKRKDTIPIHGMKSVMAHKLAGTVFSNTDILLASTFLQPISVVIYSSYNYIIKFINDGVYMVATSITASMGNVMYKDDHNTQYQIFEKTNSLFMFFGMFFSITLFVTMNRFVQLWIGNDKLIGFWAFIFLIATLFISTVNRPFLVIRDSKALYKQTKYIAIAEAIINLFFSILLVKFIGVTGLILGTVIASSTTSLIFYPKYIYKNEFKKSSKNYFLYLILAIVFSIVLCVLFSKFNLINSSSNFFIWFFSSSIYCLVIMLLVFFFNFVISKDFKLLCKDIISVFKSKRSKE